jgi:hypothetical protein
VSEVLARTAARLELLPVLLLERGVEKEEEVQGTEDAGTAAFQCGGIQESKSLKTHYELLAVESNAPLDEIKRAFRREIARYHPDKVQHLGSEFQQIAATRAAQLTEAYRVLMDEDGRRQYDQSLSEPVRATAATPDRHHSAVASGTVNSHPVAPQDPLPLPDRRFQQERATTTDFVKRVGASRVNEAVRAVAPGAVMVSLSGFDGAYDIKGKSGLFRRAEPTVRLLIRFVPHVDRDSIVTSWPLAIKASKDAEVLCLILLGAAGVAASKELGGAVAEQRRKTRSLAPIVIPVDVRDWEALFPPETPVCCRAIVQWLRDGGRS